MATLSGHLSGQVAGQVAGCGVGRCGRSLAGVVAMVAGGVVAGGRRGGQGGQVFFGLGELVLEGSGSLAFTECDAIDAAAFGIEVSAEGFDGLGAGGELCAELAYLGGLASELAGEGLHMGVRVSRWVGAAPLAAFLRGLSAAWGAVEPAAAGVCR
ncbi:hypothetical protein [Nesterenkonia sp. K-15-9-6]|uniref:hypothetical protein n=1 Tax=Nesterenkonia sp. K-15-9-6 TaxID=3093918 RepID=UPI004044EAA1